MKLVDIIIILVIAALLFLAIFYLVRNKKKCKGGCASCPYASKGCSKMPEDTKRDNTQK